MLRTSSIFKLSGAAILGALSLAAHAGDIIADYTYIWGITNVNFTTDLPGNHGPINGQGTTMFHGERTGGSDTLVPHSFNTFCVEIGEFLPEGSQRHPNVFLLEGSSTTSGGISGPVVFDSTRTANLQKLWGNFFSAVVDPNKSAAFQLATWEIAFDNDLSLVRQNGSKMWVDGIENGSNQFQSGITDVAEGWLTEIRMGRANTQVQLALLTGDGIQDEVTPVPEPGVFGAISLGMLLLARRKRLRA